MRTGIPGGRQADMGPRKKRPKHGEVAAEGAHVSEAEAVAATRIPPAVAAPAEAGTSAARGVGMSDEEEH